MQAHVVNKSSVCVINGCNVDGALCEKENIIGKFCVEHAPLFFEKSTNIILTKKHKFPSSFTEMIKLADRSATRMELEEFGKYVEEVYSNFKDKRLVRDSNKEIASRIKNLDYAEAYLRKRNNIDLAQTSAANKFYALYEDEKEAY